MDVSFIGLAIFVGFPFSFLFFFYLYKLLGRYVFVQIGLWSEPMDLPPYVAGRGGRVLTLSAPV